MIPYYNHHGKTIQTDVFMQKYEKFTKNYSCYSSLSGALLCINGDLTLKAPSKIAADDTSIFFNIYLTKKIKLDVSWESSAKQRIHMKYQVLFSLKNNEKLLKTVVCCILIGHFRDLRNFWRFKKTENSSLE